MTPCIIEFVSPVLRYGNVTIRSVEGCGIVEGVTVVAGPNGAGKTTLGTIIEKGRYAFGNRLRFSRDGMTVKMLKFTDIHSFTGVDVLRFDQRLESSENEFVPTVGEIMGSRLDDKRWDELCGALALDDVAGKKINFLSSGELRKLLVINALMSSPDILVLDNPYIG
ncbi:MAG: ATP-binding cassette domain-containing protein, partial [Duncaniella sp.]|nr:ATP-binding cassette domain-containing protein [Duncaniella sp.]